MLVNSGAENLGGKRGQLPLHFIGWGAAPPFFILKVSLEAASYCNKLILTYLLLYCFYQLYLILLESTRSSAKMEHHDYLH